MFPVQQFKLVRLFIVLWLLNPLLCRADDLSLSIDQVLALFYERNLDIIAAQYDIEQARAQEIIAAAIPNPTFNFDSNEIAPKNNDHLGPFYGFMISELIQTAGKRDLKKESSRLGTEAAETDLQDAIRLLSNAVRKSYFSLLLTQKNAEVARDNSLRYEKLKELNRLRLKQGDISEADYLRIEVEKLKADSEWNNATASVDSARSDLAKLLAWPDNAMIIKAKDEWPVNVSLTENAGVEKLLEKARSERPDIVSAQTRIAQAEKKLTLARKEAIPDVTVGLAYDHDPQNSQPNFAEVTMSVPLPLFYQNQGEIGQAVVNLNNARLDLKQTEQTIHTEVVSAFAKWQAAEKVVSRFEKDILSRVDQIRDSAELSYLKGATSIIYLVEAEKTHKSAMLDYYTALNNRTLTYADLQTAVGEKN